MLALLIAGILISVVIHEFAHVLAGQFVGFQFRGVGFTLRGPNVKLATEDPEVLRSLWIVALAGPISNAYLAAVLLFSPDQVSRTLAYFNLFLAGCNLLPIKGVDGYVALKSLRSRA